MLFNSFEYAVFLPVVFLLYWLVFTQLKWQNLFLLAVSYLFYGWWDYRFLSLLIFSSVVDFLVARQMEKVEVSLHRKRLLGISLLSNLGLLAVFKYYNFFISELITAFSGIGIDLDMRTLKVILPVGISFYTFQTLSYTIDVFRKKIKPVADWVTFFAYVSFFPQLVAGPIERASNLIPQFIKSRKFSYDQARDGMQQILWGLFKKVVIADNCAVVVNTIFANYTELNTISLILGAFLFSIQIYCDFSGYSDIAIGTARLFGFKLMRNFAFPYFSRDIAEFWRRWHISLSTWFRDYLYIPLGGSRVKSRARLVFNVAAIFLVSGCWHGANWTFIVWGALHALYFLPGILLGKNRRHLDVVAKGKVFPGLQDLINMSMTFFLVLIAWIFFRAESVSQAVDYIVRLFTSFDFSIRPLGKNVLLLFGITIMMSIEWLQRNKEHGLQLAVDQLNKPSRGIIYLTTAMAILLLAPKQPSVFIYFQF